VGHCRAGGPHCVATCPRCLTTFETTSQEDARCLVCNYPGPEYWQGDKGKRPEAKRVGKWRRPNASMTSKKSVQALGAVFAVCGSLILFLYNMLVGFVLVGVAGIIMAISYTVKD
jgi:hypothetical protein